MEILWRADNNDGTFMNPIIYADYSDPDVIRVGDTYYMTASSFNYTPGLPILISKDLVNWKLVNYATGNIKYQDYDIPQHAKGVWAPAIRYHNGEFYIYYGMPDEGIFMVKTKDPLGKWDEPVLVLEGKGLIDSCPFWDEDGKAYIIHGYAKSRIGFKSFLGIFEMNTEGTKAITEDHLLFDGTVTQHTIEGPKVYKRNGFYYILAPAGGVKQGWQTALRSKNIYGPYEEKIVMHQGNTAINGPHQGGLIDTVCGEEWFIHFQDKGMYGRIVHLQPVVWKNDWPVIGINEDDEGCGEPVIRYNKPNVGEVGSEISYLEASDDFDGDKLGLQWQWLGNMYDNFYENTENGLKLNCLHLSKGDKAILWEQSNVLTEKLVCPKFTVETCLDCSNITEGDKAGLVMMGGSYFYIAVNKIDGMNCVVCGESELNDEGKTIEKITTYESGVSSDKIVFRGVMDDCFRVEYSVDGKHFKGIPINFKPSDHTWVGAKLGIFAVADNNASEGSVIYRYFRVDKV